MSNLSKNWAYSLEEEGVRIIGSKKCIPYAKFSSYVWTEVLSSVALIIIFAFNLARNEIDSWLCWLWGFAFVADLFFVVLFVLAYKAAKKAGKI